MLRVLRKKTIHCADRLQILSHPPPKPFVHSVAFLFKAHRIPGPGQYIGKAKWLKPAQKHAKLQRMAVAREGRGAQRNRRFWLPMANRQETSVDQERLFRTTCWTDLGRALDPRYCHDTIDRLSARYWRPVFVFLCRKGYGHEDALDLTQGFFHEIVLERQLFQQADQSKGRFRTYLLTTLQHYVAEQFRKANAKKRIPSSCVTSFGSWDLPQTLAVESEASAEQLFQYTWAAELLDRALNKIKREYCTNGRAEFWHVFHSRVVIPTLHGSPPLSLSALCQIYAIPTEKKASNMVVTAKRRFQAILKRILSETMEPDSSVEAELAELISILSQRSPG